MRSGIFVGALALGALSVMAGCGPMTTSAAPTPSSSAFATTDVSRLLSRPVKLPTLVTGSSCPVTPIANVSVGIGNPRGHGSFYLGGGMPNGGFPFNKTVYVMVGGASGPVLLRGGQIDGAGRLKFSGNRADPTEQAEIRSSSGGDSWPFYQAIIGGTQEAVYLYPSTKGCYAVQVDAPGFQDVIVVKAG